MPRRDDLPGTLERSPQKAQETWLQTHDSAADQYGDCEQAHRTAFASLKRGWEKVDDHWERKDATGPSDPRSTKSTAQKRRNQGETFGGVDLYGNTKAELYARAAKLGVTGRSRMTKIELARAIDRAQG